MSKEQKLQYWIPASVITFFRGKVLSLLKDQRQTLARATFSVRSMTSCLVHSPVLAEKAALVTIAKLVLQQVFLVRLQIQRLKTALELPELLSTERIHPVATQSQLA